MSHGLNQYPMGTCTLLTNTDDGAHGVIDNFEFSCNSVENLISIWNFTNTVKKNVNDNMKISNPLRWDISLILVLKPLRRYLRYFRGTHWRSSLSRRLLAFYTWMNHVTNCLYGAQCRSRLIGEWLKRVVLQSWVVMSTIVWANSWSGSAEKNAGLLGLTLAKFNQLKRNKRFHNFIMFLWVQGSIFHIVSGSHPVQEARGSKDSLYRGQIQKLLQCCQKPYQQIPLVITIQKKSIVWPIFDVPFRRYYRKRSNCWLYRVKQVKVLQFCWQWS